MYVKNNEFIYIENENDSKKIYSPFIIKNYQMKRV